MSSTGWKWPVFLGAALAGLVFADTVNLKEGPSVEGTLQGIKDGMAEVKTDEGISLIPVANIVSIATEKTPATDSAAENPSPLTTVSQTTALGVAVPDGARAIVVLSESLDSSQHSRGHRFRGTLQSDILNGTTKVFAQGSEVYGEVVNARQPRNLVGTSGLDLKLTGVMAGSVLQSISSSTIGTESARTGKDTAKKVAFGAGVGELSDDDPGAGAAIGGLVGAATKGQTARWPSGSVLEFLIGPPGSAIASQSTQQTKQTTQRVGENRRARRVQR